MSKIFRLYKGGTETYQDWANSPTFPYNSGARDDSNMPDPDGSKACKEITSIPSPFARIDLVKNAFYEISRQENSIGARACLEGNTIFHKMVSDTLDVGEIFFNYDRFSSKVEIISWSPSPMINALASSEDEGQKCYANALKKFIDADGKSYNFDKLQNIYLLNYKNGPHQLNIIGATSPASVFFSTANRIDYINDIQFGSDFPFDNVYQPLYKRDPEYIKFWFILKNSISGFSRLFPEVNHYLDMTYSVITDNNLKSQLRTINNPSDAGFSNISVQGSAQINQVEVLGNLLFQQNASLQSLKSGFTIKSSKQPNSTVLVLPVESGNVYAELKYTTAKWGDTNKAPYMDPQADLNLRKLPNDYTQHPYLTISDFLEDSLIVVPHRLNENSFLAVNNFSNFPEGKTYLLPLKPLFFEYFSIDNLRDGMIEFEKVGIDSIKATLRIPILGNGRVNDIEYSRIYYTGSADVSETENDGGITEENNFKDFEILVVPNIRFPEGVTPEYRIATIAPFTNRTELKFFKDGKAIQTPNPIIRNTTFNIVPKSQTYVLGEDLECLQVIKQEYKGILIPTFEKTNSNNNIEFSVDLGTSNTNIEMVLNNRRTQILPFGFTQAEQLQACAFLPTYVNRGGKSYQKDLIEILQVIERDFLPLEVKSESEYNFPTRTVLSYGERTDWNQSVIPWANSNISLPFGKLPPLQYNKYKTDIKWSEEGNSEVFAESYINNLMFLIRCKALIFGANVRQVPVTWFYPTSMSPRRLAAFSQIWQNSYDKYFGGSTLKCMTESLAPVLYFFNRYATATDLVTIDIGGGTTDLAFASNKSVQYVSSFRFAANSLFEDSFSSVNPQNGIVDHFRRIYESLNIDALTSLINEFDSQPANMASTFFTLKDSPIVKKASLDIRNVDFSQLLFSDNNFKIVFLTFYTAIIYHIAQIIKVKDLRLPRHIAFSGNGSNIVRALVSTNQKGLDILSKYTKIVLEMVSNKSYASGELEILGFDQGESPKRATCRGGFLDEGNSTSPQKIVYKSADNTLVTANDTYEIVDEQYIDKVASAVTSFYDFIFNKVSKRFNLYENFGITMASLKIAKENYEADIKTYIHKGVEFQKEEQIGSEEIAETFFFYPIKGALQTISQKIKDTL